MKPGISRSSWAWWRGLAALLMLWTAVLYTGDDTRLDLPAWEALEPFQPVTGWVAVSFTMLKTYGAV
jgi:hypothetical protein